MSDDLHKTPHGATTLPDADTTHDAYARQDSWSAAIRCAYDICRQSTIPMAICLIHDSQLLYNDAWVELLDEKFKASSGHAGRDVYGEHWKHVEASITSVIDSGKTITFDRQLFGHSHNRRHDGYFNYQLQPLTVDNDRDAVLIIAERSYEDIEKHHDEFLATIAHELRNPFGALAAAAQVLNKAIDRPQMMATARDALTRQIGYLAQLLDDLLDISRLRRGRLELHRQPVSLKDVLAVSAQAAKPAMENRQHNCDVEEPDTSLRVSGDKRLLIKVFSNLLNHVAKHTESGRPLQLQTRTRDTDVDIVIRNTSFAPEAIQRAINDCLERKFTRQLGKDLDLNLYLICGLVQIHGGQISAQRDAGDTGTDFIITLPRTHVHSTAQQQASTS